MLEVTGVDVFYGDIQALWSVSIHADRESVVALVGANGAGKTTLLKAIAGLVPPRGGRILFSGKPLLHLRPEKVVASGISLVPEGRRLFSQLTVMENLELGAYTSRARAGFSDSLERAFTLFPLLKARVRQIAGSLSGGEQQMLAIARGLMSQPSALMLDEPSLGLSPLVVKTMFELIRALQREKITILLVEQNIYQALKISDFAYVLKNGKVTMTGRGEELLADPDVKKAYMGNLE
ncbi:MAG: ABC transporter ATP-binding protein [Desulfobacteraceae bacterium]|nr:MAG: ABC transporter ATP-binding protein [Desulfobacteraceae bacterium]